MNTIKKRDCSKKRLYFVLLVSFIQEVATAAGEEELLSAYGTESTVSLATGYAVPIRELPAAATVMTRRDIERLGIRTLAQALDTVPGVQVVSGRGRIRLLNIRGVFADLGPDVLIKRDNIPLTQGVFNSFNPLDLTPLTNVERIEIIRGPNSATDGADALAGSINVVTRTSSGFRGTELGARAGDHDTYDIWLNQGAKIGPFDVALGLSAWTTDGPDRILETDAQSQFDRLFGVHTSLAPGTLNFANHGTDMQLDVNSGPWHLRAGYYAVYSNLGAGIVQVIDPEAKADTHYASASLKRPSLGQGVFRGFLTGSSGTSKMTRVCSGVRPRSFGPGGPIIRFVSPQARIRRRFIALPY